MEFLPSFLKDWEANIHIKVSFDRRIPEGLGVGVQNLRGEIPHMGARPGTPPRECMQHHGRSTVGVEPKRESIVATRDRDGRDHLFPARDVVYVIIEFLGLMILKHLSSPSLDNVRRSLASEVKME